MSMLTSLACGFLEHGGIQAILAAEVIVDGRNVRLCELADLLARGAHITPLGEHTPRDFEQLLLGLCTILARSQLGSAALGRRAAGLRGFCRSFGDASCDAHTLRVEIQI